jgi:hypothetical protein
MNPAAETGGYMKRLALVTAAMVCFVFGYHMCSWAAELSRSNAQNLLMEKFDKDLTFRLNGVREVEPDTFEVIVVPESVRSDHLKQATCIRNLSEQDFIEATVTPSPPHEWGPEQKYTFKITETFRNNIISRDYSGATFSFLLRVGELSGVKIQGMARVNKNARIVKYCPVYRLNALAAPLQIINDIDVHSAVFQLHDDGWRVERTR